MRRRSSSGRGRGRSRRRGRDRTERAPLRVGAVQVAWSSDAAEHRANLAAGVALAAGNGARLVASRS